MNEPNPPATPLPPVRTSRRKRNIVILLLFLSFVVVVPAVLLSYKPILAEWHLRQAIAEADRIDPGWRLEELQARRKPIPDSDNPALRAKEASQLLPKEWLTWKSVVRKDVEEKDWKQKSDFEHGLWDLPSPVRLSEEQSTAIRLELKELEPALKEFRKLASAGDGRLAFQPDPKHSFQAFNESLDFVKIALLLRWDAALQAEQEDSEGALLSCRAILGLGRSIGDEPELNTQEARGSCSYLAVQAINRTLAQGTVSDASLLDASRLLEVEESHPLLLISARGMRACADQDLLAKQNDPPSTAEILRLEQVGSNKPAPNSILNWLPFSFGKSETIPADEVKEMRAWLLRYFTKYVEISKMPLKDQGHHFDDLYSTVTQQRPHVRLLCYMAKDVPKVEPERLTRLRCAVTALAIERYRIAHNNWPKNLDELVKAGLLKDILLDAFDETPLRYKRVEDGVIVYSVGPDKTDKGVSLVRLGTGATDIKVGFQLWDVNKRRQLQLLQLVPVEKPLPWAAPGIPPPIPPVPPGGK